MTALLSEIRADIEFRHRLVYPGGSGPLGWLRASVFSRGTLVLAVHRLSRRAVLAKADGHAMGRPLGWLASVARRVVLVMAKAHVANSTRIAAGVCLPDGGVWIGSDCLVYGAIVVGDGATVLPGSVVTKHIPPGAVVSGNPPRLVAASVDNSRLRSSLATSVPSAWPSRGALTG